jgi:Dyp-type peroxidase family
MTDRALDFDEIQGNVLAGFNTDIQMLIALTVRQPADFPAAAKWLAQLAPSVTVVSEVRANRPLMKAGGPNGGTWLCVAIGQRLLKATQSDVLIRDEAFNVGMLKRAPSVLSDKTDSSKWCVGGPDDPVDVLLIVAANDEKAVFDRADSLSASASRFGLTATYREPARRMDDREHFGFRDGISQPKVLGYDADGELGPGNFVFGYPQQPGSDPFSPVIDPRGITDNGSMLVFRRLAQNVLSFRKFCMDESARLAPQWPGLTQDHLAALLVGRWPSGAPIKAGQTKDPGGSQPDNSFDFRDDPDAVSCPFGAHIRKVNPREGPKDVRPVPRMLRRGIPFGPAFDTAPEVSNRGLAFLAFQTSIKSQFEFLTLHWMNSEANPAPENDIVVGRSDGVRVMKVPGPQGPIEVSASDMSWIVPTGGAYLFVPSRSGLAKFDTPSAPLGLWKAHQLWAITADSVKGYLFD